MKGGIRPTVEDEEAGLDLPEMGVLAYDNLQVRELDIVGVDEDIVMTGGPSQDPSIGRYGGWGTAPAPSPISRAQHIQEATMAVS